MQSFAKLHARQPTREKKIRKILVQSFHSRSKSKMNARSVTLLYFYALSWPVQYGDSFWIGGDTTFARKPEKQKLDAEDKMGS